MNKTLDDKLRFSTQFIIKRQAIRVNSLRRCLRFAHLRNRYCNRVANILIWRGEWMKMGILRLCRLSSMQFRHPSTSTYDWSLALHEFYVYYKGEYWELNDWYDREIISDWFHRFSFWIKWLYRILFGSKSPPQEERVFSYALRVFLIGSTETQIRFYEISHSCLQI